MYILHPSIRVSTTKVFAFNLMVLWFNILTIILVLTSSINLIPKMLSFQIDNYAQCYLLMIQLTIFVFSFSTLKQILLYPSEQVNFYSRVLSKFSEKLTFCAEKCFSLIFRHFSSLITCKILAQFSSNLPPPSAFEDALILYIFDHQNNF